MKFTVEISEHQIQTMLDDTVRHGNYKIRALLDEAVTEAFKVELQFLLKTKFSKLMEVTIEKEIRKVNDQKISGWVKRRIKEMLETVRKAEQLTKED